MTTSILDEFQQKVRELRDKLDFENGTAQKNKTLLLTLKDLCNSALKESPNDQKLGALISKELNAITNDMKKIRGISHDDGSNSSQSHSVKQNIFTAGRPTKDALTSIQAGGFDPSSSPILRGLTKRKVPRKMRKVVHPPQDISPSNINNSPESSSHHSSSATESSASQPLDSSVRDKTDNQIKKLQDSLADFEAKPFPKEKTLDSPKKGKKEGSKSAKSQYIDAKLIIAQLELEFPLHFEESKFQIGRQLFDDLSIQIELPDNFFEPILPISSKKDAPKEHCVIEQDTKGKFSIYDRGNAQKTYFQGKFLKKEKIPLKPGDEFILPVLINDQMASLSVEFQV
ncbi:MAG: FHA domain-containing protein [Promethearchaeota archaeon]